jgi:hypothetical protein
MGAECALVKLEEESPGKRVTKRELQAFYPTAVSWLGERKQQPHLLIEEDRRDLKRVIQGRWDAEALEVIADRGRVIQ